MFDYLGILISVILGLALTHLLMGVSRLIQAPPTVKVYWVQVVWTVNIAIYVMAVWWGMYWWKHLQTWTVQEYLFLAGYSIVLFILASMLFPHEWGEQLDFEENFFRHRRWFFGLQTLAFLLDVPETVAKSASHLRAVPREYIAFVMTILALSIAGLMTSNRRAHAVISVLWLGLFTAYMTLSAIDKIVAS